MDYLSDGAEEHGQHIYALHKSLGAYEQAAKTALIIAKKEQDAGNYLQTHSLLFSAITDLKTSGNAVSLELHKRLMLLHSYVIVRRLIKSGNHLNASRMLLRV